VTRDLQSVIYPVKDLEQAKALYAGLLGTAPTSDAPYYVGFSLDGVELGLDPNGHAHGMTGPVAYWHVADINAKIAELVSNGAEIQQSPRDVGGGTLIATLKDSDGNPIGLFQAP
jgi:predicted enzyme related to lactoylglutathione lyase